MGTRASGFFTRRLSAKAKRSVAQQKKKASVASVSSVVSTPDSTTATTTTTGGNSSFGSRPDRSNSMSSGCGGCGGGGGGGGGGGSSGYRSGGRGGGGSGGATRKMGKLGNSSSVEDRTGSPSLVQSGPSSSLDDPESVASSSETCATGRTNKTDSTKRRITKGLKSGACKFKNVL